MKFRQSPQFFKSAFATGAALCAFAIVASKTNLAFAQTFNSGSTGADGALDLTGKPSGTVVDFDPKALGIDPEGDNVFHFTTITIPAGVTLRMSAKWTNGPVYWLATGAVNIAGTVNLSGEAGAARSQSNALRVVSIPGPGGYPGGLGGNSHAESRGVAQPGAGPVGGTNNGGATCSIPGWGQGAGLAGSKFLIPLVGGSGGGGGTDPNFEWWGGGGGAGGGALLVSSNQSITVGGQIRADGGNGGNGTGQCSFPNYIGGAGAGGALRFVAPIVTGTGTISVSGGTPPTGACNWGHSCYNAVYGAVGQVRIEAYQQNWTYAISGPYTTGSPLNSYVPTTPPPSLQVISVGGVSVRPDPTGSFDAADVTINSNAATAVTIQAKYVPVGTVPTLYVFSLEGKDQTLQATPLSGSYELSTATAQVLFPSGFTRGYVRAKWTPAP